MKEHVDNAFDFIVLFIILLMTHVACKVAIWLENTEGVSK